MRRPWWIAVLLVAGLVLVARPAPRAATPVPDIPVETVVPTTAEVDNRRSSDRDDARARGAVVPSTPPTAPPTPAPPLPSTSTTGPTTTTRPTDAAETTWPLVQFLPHETPTWSVDFRIAAGRLVLTVTLLTVLNRPEQVAERRAALTAAKADVLAWLDARRGGQSYEVVWRPGEAAGL